MVFIFNTQSNCFNGLKINIMVLNACSHCSSNKPPKCPVSGARYSVIIITDGTRKFEICGLKNFRIFNLPSITTIFH